MKSLTRISMICLAVSGAGLLGGCNRNASRAPAMTPAAGAVSARDNAIHQISITRCERDERCNDIGTGKHYESLIACEDERDRDARENAGECKGGVDQNRLNECLSAIRAEQCGSPLDTLERLVACRKAPCLK
jgi:hypothetical protein